MDDKTVVYLMCPTEDEVKNLYDSEPRNCGDCKVLVFAKTKNLANNPHVICAKCWAKRKPQHPEAETITDAEYHRKANSPFSHLTPQNTNTKEEVKPPTTEELEKGYVVCSKTEFGPSAPDLQCRVEKCSGCSCGLWLSQAMFAMVDIGALLPICNSCAAKECQKNPSEFKDIRITEGQRVELRKSGVTDGMIDELMGKIIRGELSLEDLDRIRKARRGGLGGKRQE